MSWVNSNNNNIRIVEVGPRDGLQNERATIESNDKIEFIQRLANAGLSTIEVTRELIRISLFNCFLSQLNQNSMLFFDFIHFTELMQVCCMFRTSILQQDDFFLIQSKKIIIFKMCNSVC